MRRGGRASARTRDAVRGLLDFAPTTPTRLAEDGSEEMVATAELTVGEIILIRPGERFGADGPILTGASEIDQSTITGEPLPAAKETGDEVFAGTLNGTGALRVKVERDASDSVTARIVTMVEEASQTKAPPSCSSRRSSGATASAWSSPTLAVFLIPWGSVPI